MKRYLPIYAGLLVFIVASALGALAWYRHVEGVAFRDMRIDTEDPS